MTEGRVARMHQVLDFIEVERRRQEQLKADGRFTFTCADVGLSDTEKLAVLVEEVGEVARALMEAKRLVSDVHGDCSMGHVRKELIQVAAVAAAWAESLSDMP